MEQLVGKGCQVEESHGDDGEGEAHDDGGTYVRFGMVVVCLSILFKLRHAGVRFMAMVFFRLGALINVGGCHDGICSAQAVKW